MQGITRIDVLPSLSELRVDMEVNRLDLFSQRSERPLARDFSDAPRTPLRIIDPDAKPSAHELSGTLPLDEPRFDPPLVPSVARVDVRNRHRSAECYVARKYLPARSRLRHYRGSQDLRNDAGGIDLDLIVGESTSAPTCGGNDDTTHDVVSKRRQIPRVRFGQDVPPFLAGDRTNHDRPVAGNDRIEWVTPDALFLSRNAGSELR